MTFMIGLAALGILTGQAENPTGDFRVVARQADGVMNIDAASWSREGDVARARGAVYLQVSAERRVVGLGDIHVNCADSTIRAAGGAFYETDMTFIMPREPETQWYPINTAGDRKIVDFMCGTDEGRRASIRERYSDVRAGFAVLDQ